MSMREPEKSLSVTGAASGSDHAMAHGPPAGPSPPGQSSAPAPRGSARDSDSAEGASMGTDNQGQVLPHRVRAPAESGSGHSQAAY
jgi:hypothetical protein